LRDGALPGNISIVLSFRPVLCQECRVSFWETAAGVRLSCRELGGLRRGGRYFHLAAPIGCGFVANATMFAD
jgi:hypothetical protein